MANRNFLWCVRTRPALTLFTSLVCLYISQVSLSTFAAAFFNFNTKNEHLANFINLMLKVNITLFVSCVSIMKLWTCFSARDNSNFLDTTATNNAVQPAPWWIIKHKKISRYKFIVSDAQLPKLSLHSQKFPIY